VLEGEILYHEGGHDAAFVALREAVALNDGDPALVFDMSQQATTIVYDEPWGWMMPARHALGALLLDRAAAEDTTRARPLVDEAEACYRADLGLAEGGATVPHPHNVWSVAGLVDCLARRIERGAGAVVERSLGAVAAHAELSRAGALDQAADAFDQARDELSRAEHAELSAELEGLRRGATVEITASCCCSSL
jgi:hypothetical protein